MALLHTSVMLLTRVELLTTSAAPGTKSESFASCSWTIHE